MMNDSDLKREVENELQWEPSVNAAHIGVAVHEGIVTLTGHVPSLMQKHLAEKAVKRVYGVQAVADELEVRLGGTSKRTDEEIAQDCLFALKSGQSVPAEQIKVVVAQAWVTLDGVVEWQYQREAATNCIRDLKGVRGITNTIRIAVKASADDVRRRILAAFHRSADLDARRINVEATNGKALLTGCVRSWAERDEAQKAAWAAPGVTTVDNKISVSP